MEATCSSEMLLDFNGVHDITSWKIELYTWISWYCYCPIAHLDSSIVEQLADFQDCHGEQYGGQPILIHFSLSNMAVCWVLRWELHYYHTWLSNDS
jgi:hypothetical protein